MPNIEDFSAEHMAPPHPIMSVIDQERPEVFFAEVEASIRSGPAPTAYSEIERLLGPVADRINRIVALGIGVPSRANGRSWGPLAQIALLDKMRECVEGAGTGRKIPVFYQDPAVTEQADLDFLEEHGYTVVPYDQKADDPNPPTRLAFVRNEIQCLAPTLVEGLGPAAAEITRTTLLYMPCLGSAMSLRVVAATNPLMVIGNNIEHLYENTLLKGLAHPNMQQVLKPIWDAELGGYQKLRDHYWRQPVTLDYGCMVFSCEEQPGCTIGVSKELTRRVFVRSGWRAIFS